MRTSHSPIRRIAHLSLAPGIVLTTSLFGCATRSFVQEEVGRLDTSTSAKLSEVQTGVDRNRDAIVKLGEIDARHETRLAEISETASEALERALAADKLAHGKFLHEVVLTEDAVRFPFESAQLEDEAVAAIDRFAAEIVQRNENVYIEIQGHTDSSGADAFNLELGQRRATTVMRYLHEKHGFPLHRMNVISYGSHHPTADNATREGRTANRRVALVVLS